MIPILPLLGSSVQGEVDVREVKVLARMECAVASVKERS